MLTSSHSCAVAVALGATLRPARGAAQYTARHYMRNQFHPIPHGSAPKGVCETFALARGVVPITTTVAALLSNRRQHSSFAGSPKEFLRDIRDNPTLVFFYKPVCEPCKVIRERLIHTVSHPFDAMKGTSASSALNGDSTASRPNPYAASEKKKADTKDASSSSSLAAAPCSDSTVDALSVEDIVLTATDVMSRPPRDSPRSTDDRDENTSDLCEEDAVICHRIKKQLREELSDYADRIRIVFVDTNANPRVTALHDIRSLPTFVAYVEGRPLGRVEGAHEEELMTLLRRLVNAAEMGVVEPDGTL